MKTKICLLVFTVFIVVSMNNYPAYSQSAESQQLLLNVEKLSQLRNILKDMKKGYEVISKSYSGIKNIAKGNFSLHDVFISGLMVVSPGIRKYGRIKDILETQQRMVTECKLATKRFRLSNTLSPGEGDYIENVYRDLLSETLNNLQELTLIITSSKLSMNDEERLGAIDRIFLDTTDKLEFLQSFNRKTNVLVLQRKQAGRENNALDRLFKHN